MGQKSFRASPSTFRVWSYDKPEHVGYYFRRKQNGLRPVMRPVVGYNALTFTLTSVLLPTGLPGAFDADFYHSVLKGSHTKLRW